MEHSDTIIKSENVVANIVIVLMASATIAWNVSLILAVSGLSIWLYSGHGWLGLLNLVTTVSLLVVLLQSVFYFKKRARGHD